MAVLKVLLAYGYTNIFAYGREDGQVCIGNTCLTKTSEDNPGQPAPSKNIIMKSKRFRIFFMGNCNLGLELGH